MGKNDLNDLQNQLMAAYKALTNSQPQQALEKLKEIKPKWPDNSDVEHLLALSYKSLGVFNKSEEHFIKCLRINQEQPEVYNNFANLLKAKGDLSGAQSYYLRALSLQENYLEARRNLAICYQAQNQLSLAIEAYLKTTELSPDDVSSHTGIADCKRLMGDYEEASQAYKYVLSIDSKRPNAWHNLGVNHHLQGMLSEAIKCYKKAYELSPSTPEIAQSYALSEYENGNVESAIELFTNALNMHPANIELHERFNNMLWETEYANRFGDSYEVAIKRFTNNQALVLSYASMLFKAGRVEQAKAIAGDLSLSNGPDNPESLQLKGSIDAELGKHESAYQFLEQSLELKYSSEVAHQMVKLDIILYRYPNAQKLLTNIFSRKPHCQLSWALQSLVWRFSEDQRYDWLCDYSSFVKVYEIQQPPKYGSLDDFLAEVRQVLDAMHRNQNQPLEQTLRNGTQTAARLLDSTNTVLTELKACLHRVVKEYIAALPEDKNHPLLARKSNEFEFSGSWSVKLRANGFHVNHVHPEGWISSSCYITIPESMNISGAEERQNQGDIKFGESPLQLGDRERVELCVEPKPGMVVLFPSYFWHGTYPFDGGPSDSRLTAPFDAVPR